VVAGVNSNNTLDLKTVNGITRGTGTVYYLDPHQPTARAHEWNVTVEREILANTSAKLSYVGNHGSRLAQYNSYNDAANAYIWYTTTGVAMPTGEYANVARRNFDQQVFGTIWRYQKSGWSNDNSSSPSAASVFEGVCLPGVLHHEQCHARRRQRWVDQVLQAPNLFLPGAVPADDQKRNRL